MGKKKFAVIGIGRFGSVIATTLAQKGAEVMVIDRSEEVIGSIANEVSSAVALDATDKRALLSQNITDFDAVVVAIGEDFEQRLLCTALLQELGVKRIIARAGGENQRLILKKIGIKEILSPEDEVGINVSERLLNPSIISYLQLPDNYEIVEIIPPKKILNRTIEDIGIRTRFHLNLLTIKTETEPVSEDPDKIEYHTIGMPEPTTTIKKNHFLVIFGKKTHIEKFLQINE